jgi:hypothetical protein
MIVTPLVDSPNIPAIFDQFSYSKKPTPPSNNNFLASNAIAYLPLPLEPSNRSAPPPTPNNNNQVGIPLKKLDTEPGTNPVPIALAISVGKLVCILVCFTEGSRIDIATLLASTCACVGTWGGVAYPCG